MHLDEIEDEVARLKEKKTAREKEERLKREYARLKESEEPSILGKIWKEIKLALKP